MTKTRQLFAGLTVALAWWLTADSASAQQFHSWVSSTGSGTACTRAVPCLQITDAQTVTNPGGVISVLDPSDYNLFVITITKPLTIRAEGVDSGVTLTASGSFPIVIQAGANDVVTLEGLHFNGVGIQFNSGGQLHIVRCAITNNNVSGSAGISFRPNSPSRLNVTDTVINNVGSGTGGGIVVNPQSGGTAQVALERLTINGNAFGIAADGTGSSGGINMTIADSMIANNSQDGIIAVTPSAARRLAFTSRTQSL